MSEFYVPPEGSFMRWAEIGKETWWTNGHMLLPADRVNCAVRPPAGNWELKNGNLRTLPDNFGVPAILQKPKTERVLADTEFAYEIGPFGDGIPRFAKAFKWEGQFTFLSINYLDALTDAGATVFKQEKELTIVLAYDRANKLIGGSMPMRVEAPEDDLKALCNQLELLKCEASS